VVIAPMRHGHRLTRRSALNVVFSSALPRSVNAWVAACKGVDGALFGGQRPTGDLLDRRGQRGLLALVAQVAEDGMHLVGSLG
jgi:hypothetical protein